MFEKYGVRYGIAYIVCIIFQLVHGWNWLDFAGRCFVTGLLVAATYPLGTWITKRLNN